ncbi:MAG: hypothetical protein NC078_00785 [Ruminococcus sp.]|nr:hypothetical protein [Ruminococcus sp.]
MIESMPPAKGFGFMSDERFPLEEPRYIEDMTREEFDRELQKGIDSARNGKCYTHEEINTRLDRLKEWLSEDMPLEKPKSLEDMTKEEFDREMQEAIDDIKAGNYYTLEEFSAFIDELLKQADEAEGQFEMST